MNEKGETLHKNQCLLKRYFLDKISQVADEKPATNLNQPYRLDFTPEEEEKPNRYLESKI